MKTQKTISKRTWAKILKRIKAKCAICGWNKATCDIHHIQPQSKGGLDTAENLVILCPNCHREAHTQQISQQTMFKVRLSVVHKHWEDHYHEPTDYTNKRPSKATLEKLAFSIPTMHIATRFGVCPKTVRKWCAFYKLEIPGKGYWKRNPYVSATALQTVPIDQKNDDGRR